MANSRMVCGSGTRDCKIQGRADYRDGEDRRYSTGRPHQSSEILDL